MGHHQHHQPTTPHLPPTFRKSEWEYIVQIEVPNTSECQEGVPSQGPVAFDAPES